MNAKATPILKPAEAGFYISNIFSTSRLQAAYRPKTKAQG